MILDDARQMSMVDDTRKLLQDLLVPDLKALTTSVEAIEKSLGMNPKVRT